MLKTKNPSDEHTADTPPVLKKTHTWWQWLLIYPTLLVTLVSSIPTYLELARSYKFGVPYGQSASAQQQHDLWNKNFSCTKAPPNWVPTAHDYEVDATICDSGDILVWVKGPRSEPRFTWVPVDGLIDKGARASLLSVAYAIEPTTAVKIGQSGGTVICQRFVGDGRLLRRVQTSSGCYDEIINTYTGQVIQQNAAPCDPNC